MKEVENIIDEKKQGEAASPAKKVTTILSTFADDSKDLKAKLGRKLEAPAKRVTVK